MKLNKEEIAKVLTERKALLPCHRCGKQSFTIVDGYTKIPMQEDIDEIQNTLLGGPSVPAVLVACNNCGAITMHALGALGLLPNKVEAENAKKE